MRKIGSNHIGRLFLIRSGNHFRIIKQKDLMYIRANSNYSVLVLDDKTECTLCYTLEYIESILNQTFFFRCHKTYLVNLSKIIEISLNKNELTMIGNIKIPIARRKRRKFIEALQNIESSIRETNFLAFNS
jgi:two-component system LytT family response regulator